MKQIILLTILLFSGINITKAQFSNIFEFGAQSNGRVPYGDLISDGTFLYGMASKGGTSNTGIVFKIKPDGSGFTKLHDFDGGLNGGDPKGSLVYDGTFLYGMTSKGGTNTDGILFKIKTDGTGFSKLLDFNGPTSGRYPEGTLFLNGVNLYGMTRMGGSVDYGVIFTVKTDGTGFTMLKDLNDHDQGRNPYGSFVTDGTFLYGMMRNGGALSTTCANDGCGTVFKIKMDGTGFAKILDLANDSNHGYSPFGDLVYDGTFLFGMTHLGGSGTLGTLFKIKPDGSQYSKLVDFTSANGSFPNGSLKYDGAFLYGFTMGGGANSSGTIFKMKPDGSGFTILHSFAGLPNGYEPLGSPFMHLGSLYGMTSYGGAGCPEQAGPSGCGTIFRYQLTPTLVKEFSEEAFMKVSPNPSSGIFTVELNEAQVQISVRDILGNRIVNKEYVDKESVNIDLSKSAKGVYFLEVISGDKKMIKKIVVE